MKPEYWKEKNRSYYYKALVKKGERWSVIEVSPNFIEIGNCAVGWWITALAKPCTEAAFTKRYQQTLKKIERAVGK